MDSNLVKHFHQEKKTTAGAPEGNNIFCLKDGNVNQGNTYLSAADFTTSQNLENPTEYNNY